LATASGTQQASGELAGCRTHWPAAWSQRLSVGSPPVAVNSEDGVSRSVVLGAVRTVQVQRAQVGGDDRTRAEVRRAQGT
ncbi:hypothetical protein, partial [Kitasatospora atroaurantiaca]|uniref:hypothetical protein n=1 Tax=Kitasatospora atroaurantiaca TaxID=285545 RepID=UPI0031E00812